MKKTTFGTEDPWTITPEGKIWSANIPGHSIGAEQAVEVMNRMHNALLKDRWLRKHPVSGSLVDRFELKYEIKKILGELLFEEPE